VRDIFSAHFPVSSKCNCSDISSHILIGVAIIGKLKSVFSLAVTCSFIIYFGAVLQDLSWKILYVRYISSGIELLKCLTSGCSSVTEIRWGVHWVKVLPLYCILWSVLGYKTKWHTWHQSNSQVQISSFPTKHWLWWNILHDIIESDICIFRHAARFMLRHSTS
jgi:hypothetical protein